MHTTSSRRGAVSNGVPTRGLSNYGIGFDLPIPQLVVFLWIAVLAGTVAAVLPARRAARLNVLQALQYE